jgi:hypothetical protein
MFVAALGRWRCEVWTMVDLKMAIYEMEISLGGCGNSAAQW